VTGGSVSGNKFDGITAEKGGHAVVKDVRVEGNQKSGVWVSGKGSRAEVTGGSVSGSKAEHGITALDGGHAVLKDVEGEDNQVHGIFVDGDGSRADVTGGSVGWSKTRTAVECLVIELLALRDRGAISRWPRKNLFPCPE